MKSLTLDQLEEAWLNNDKPFGPFRELKTPDDWGDDATIGVHLKRKNTNIISAKESDFGRFLGGTLVGIKNWEGRIISGELFDSLDELKSIWVID